MSTLSTARRAAVRPVVIGCALSGAVALVCGCGTGRNAPTRMERAVTNGVQANAGNVVLRNVLLTADVPAGTATRTLQLEGLVANNTGGQDQLTSVRTATSIPFLASALAASASGAAPSAAPSSGATSSGTAATATIAPGTPVRLGSEGLNLSVSGLPAAVLPGSTLSVTFTFQQAGVVTVAVPVYAKDALAGDLAPSGAVTYPAPEVPDEFNEPEYDNQSASSS